MGPGALTPRGRFTCFSSRTTSSAPASTSANRSPMPAGHEGLGSQPAEAAAPPHRRWPSASADRPRRAISSTACDRAETCRWKCASTSAGDASASALRAQAPPRGVDRAPRPARRSARRCGPGVRTRAPRPARTPADPAHPARRGSRPRRWSPAARGTRAPRAGRSRDPRRIPPEPVAGAGRRASGRSPRRRLRPSREAPATPRASGRGRPSRANDARRTASSSPGSTSNESFSSRSRSRRCISPAALSVKVSMHSSAGRTGPCSRAPARTCSASVTRDHVLPAPAPAERTRFCSSASGWASAPLLDEPAPPGPRAGRRTSAARRFAGELDHPAGQLPLRGAPPHSASSAPRRRSVIRHTDRKSQCSQSAERMGKWPSRAPVISVSTALARFGLPSSRARSRASSSRLQECVRAEPCPASTCERTPTSRSGGTPRPPRARR